MTERFLNFWRNQQLVGARFPGPLVPSFGFDRNLLDLLWLRWSGDFGRLIRRGPEDLNGSAFYLTCLAGIGGILDLVNRHLFVRFLLDIGDADRVIYDHIVVDRDVT